MPRRKIIKNYTHEERLDNLNRQLHSVEESNADLQRQITQLHHRISQNSIAETRIKNDIAEVEKLIHAAPSPLTADGVCECGHAHSDNTGTRCLVCKSSGCYCKQFKQKPNGEIKGKI